MAIFALLLVACCLGLAGCGEGDEKPKTQTAAQAKGSDQTQARPPFILVAHYTSAGPQGRAVLSLWLRPAPAGGSPMEAPDWSQTLSIIPQGGEPVEGGIRLVSAPEAKALDPGKGNLYHAVYELSPPARPEAGARFDIRLSTAQGPLRAGPLRVSASPANPIQALRRQARVAKAMGDGGAMIKAGLELSKAEPASPGGPFWVGRGLEQKGDYQGALDAYWSALKLAMAQSPSPEREPPTPIVRRIKLMRWLLEKQKGQAG